MNQNKELERMMKWGKVLDTATNIIGKIIQVFCIVGIVLLLIQMSGIATTYEGTVDLRILSSEVVFESLSRTMQNVVIIVMIVLFIFSVILVGELVKALRSVFQAMANGRPFEETAVKGFRKAAIWMLVIGILAGVGTGIVIAALFLLLSYVFHYGMVLQQESDELL